ncbi:MAG TPA: hypothetical protein VL860_09535 [Planctomycetota bacterium]|nr:hypothetical protein [Planctomycetota bacterium]
MGTGLAGLGAWIGGLDARAAGADVNPVPVGVLSIDPTVKPVGDAPAVVPAPTPAPAPAPAPAAPAITPEAQAALDGLRAHAIALIAARVKAAAPVTMELVIEDQPRLVDLQEVDPKGGLLYKQFGKKGRVDLTAALPRLLADVLLGLTADEQETAAEQHLDAGLLYMVEGKALESAAQIDKAHALDGTLDAHATELMKKLPKPPAPENASPDLGGLFKNTGGGETGYIVTPQGTNQEGRKLGPLPKITQAILSGTPESDAVMANLQLLPKNHALYDDISKCAVLPNSDAIIAEVGADEVLNPDYSFNFVIAPPNQAKVDVAIVPKNDESDPGPYPVPDNAPIEGWGPGKFGNKIPFETWQRTGTGDRHCLVVDPAGGRFFEFFSTHKTASGWQAVIAANWPSNTIAQRRLKWSSADAAGLPILPTLVRYDELQRGMVEHAMRFCARRTRKEFLYPASHYAATGTSSNCPAMGERLRLKASVNIDSFGPQSRAIALALKKYGMIIADNGNYLSISMVIDERMDDPDCKNLRKLKIRDFEVVRGYGEHEGPRAP